MPLRKPIASASCNCASPDRSACRWCRQPPKRPLKLMTRAEILASDPTRLERLGRRLIVGFESFSEVKTLVEKRAIAGIFVTDHNVRGRKAADVAKDIQDLQDIRKTQGLPRLFVAADQEGGYVSRLSPPLKRQPTLGMLDRQAQDRYASEKKPSETTPRRKRANSIGSASR